MVRSFAPGEIILFGEHSVVYGKRALAVSIEKGIETVFSNLGENIVINSELGELKAQLTNNGDMIVEKISDPLKPFLNMIQRSFNFTGSKNGFKAVITSEIPSASGLASSSAVSASFIAGLIFYLGKRIDKKELLDLVYKSEIDIQKRGSIIGSACAVYGGLIEVLKGVVKNHSLPSSLGDVIIVNSREQCSTEITTGIVKDKLDKDPSGIKKIFGEMHRIASDGKDLLSKGYLSSFGELLNSNQKCLKALGVSTKKIDKYMLEVQPYVYGTKITGAGGGGCLFSVVKEDCTDQVFKKAKDFGLDAFKTDFREYGVEVNGESI